MAVIFVYACRVCGGRMERPAGTPGRPPTMCSRTCRNAADRQYRHERTAARLAASAVKVRAEAARRYGHVLAQVQA
ncbi:MAG: hypothetical protein ACJ71T_12065 [Actinomycetales bacterium]